MEKLLHLYHSDRSSCVLLKICVEIVFEMWFVPVQVLSGRRCSNLRRNAPLDSFLAKGRSSVKVFSFLYVSRYSTEPNNEFGHSSKRRSRGPLMAAKKASEGLQLTACTSFTILLCNVALIYHCVWLGEKQEDGKYKHTVDLPKTGFGMRANSLTREPELQKLWDEHQVFKRVSDNNNGVSFSRFSYVNFALRNWCLIVSWNFRGVSFFMMVLLMLMVICIWVMLLTRY